MACSKNAVEIAEALLRVPNASQSKRLSAAERAVQCLQRGRSLRAMASPSKSTVALVQRLLDAKADPAVIIMSISTKRTFRQKSTSRFYGTKRACTKCVKFLRHFQCAT